MSVFHHINILLCVCIFRYLYWCKTQGFMSPIAFGYFDRTIPRRAVLLLSILSWSNGAEEKEILGVQKWRCCYLTHLVQGINLKISFDWGLGSLDKACGGLWSSEWHLVQLAQLSHMWLISRSQKKSEFCIWFLSWLYAFHIQTAEQNSLSVHRYSLYLFGNHFSFTF